MSTRSRLLLEKLLGRLVAEDGQEIFLTPGNDSRIKQYGDLKILDEGQPISEEFISTISKEILSEKQLQELDIQKELVVTQEIGSTGRFRLQFYFQKGVLSLNLRRIAAEVPLLVNLDIPQQVKDLRQLHHGLILISGPYDSGRSTLTAAFLKNIVKERALRVMTLEKPLECVLTSQRGVIEQREIGKDVTSVLHGLTKMKEGAVDVIFLSQLESAAESKLILELALSNKLVFVVVSSDSAVRTLEQFLQFFPETQTREIAAELADALKAVINLRLVKQTGRSGRLYVVELLLINLITAAAIRERDMRRLATLLQTSRQDGMQTLEQHLLELLRSGKITAESALQVARDPSWLGQQLGK